MNTTFKRILIIVTSLAVIFIGLFKFMQMQTKKASPEATVNYKKDGKDLSVFYCRPSKRDREIFGGLVPYGKVWRTGANEATTFTTATDIKIAGQTLSAGTYTLWTIPEKESWTVIFNKKQYGWGISFGGEASREPAADVINLSVPIEKINEPEEIFTIAFDDLSDLKLVLTWDQTRVSVPIQ